VRCVDCTLVYLRGYEDDGVETRSDDYVRAKIVDSCNQLGEQDQLFVRRLQWAQERVRGRRVLDIGCGNGAFLLSARELGWQALGVDTSEAARDLLASTGIEVHLDDAARFLRSRPQSFDFIHMNHSLEHIPHAPETVLAAREALAPHGILYVEVPNEFDNLLYRTLELVGRKRRAGSLFGKSKPPREPSPHLYFFNPRSMARLARRAGFGSFEVHARRREPLQLDPSELLSNVAARLGAGPFLTLIARA
jgi:SAM-dependent methyltransferase